MEIVFSKGHGKSKHSAYELTLEFESFLTRNPEWQGSSRSIASAFNDFLTSKEKALSS